MDKYGYIGIETLLNYCENSKEHAVTPNEFMRMNRVRMPEQQWIPVTDRLPEESKEVLICTDDGLLYIAEHEYLFDRFYWEETTEYRTVENVVAWMPLPESYKGEQG